jgi:hypothetical protein
MRTIAGAALLAAVAFAPAPVHAQAQAAYTAPAADVEAVRQAALNYVDAIYRADPSLVRTSVHPSLAKRGFYVDREGVWHESPMTFDQLIETARTWNDDGRTLREGAPRAVEIHEVLNRIASARITAQWGVDYLQLAKFDDGWKIVNIVWQSPPRAER